MNTIDRWNEIMLTITEDEAKWLSLYHEHHDEIALKLIELDDFVCKKLVTPTEGCCFQLESLLIKMRNKLKDA